MQEAHWVCFQSEGGRAGPGARCTEQQSQEALILHGALQPGWPAQDVGMTLGEAKGSFQRGLGYEP